MKKCFYKLGLLGILGMLMACGGGGDDSPPPPPPPPPEVEPPIAATLVFPDQDSECNEGTVVSDTQSEVTFRWNASQHTDSYTLNIKNLLTQTTESFSATSAQFKATILRGTPYSWSVTSKSNSVSQTAESAVWKFYNAGEGVVNHPPFPADLVSPSMGANLNVSSGQISLDWNSSDIENDVINFDVYIDKGLNPPTTKAATVTESAYSAQVEAGVYYWRVVSRDAEDNTSQSAVYQFRVN